MGNELRKLSLESRRWRIADELNIEQCKVKAIIDRYIELCRENLLNGHVVQIFGLVTLVPDVKVDDFIATTAWYSKQISMLESVPFYTALQTVKGYLESMQET